MAAQQQGKTEGLEELIEKPQTVQLKRLVTDMKEAISLIQKEECLTLVNTHGTIIGTDHKHATTIIFGDAGDFIKYVKADSAMPMPRPIILRGAIICPNYSEESGEDYEDDEEECNYFRESRFKFDDGLAYFWQSSLQAYFIPKQDNKK